MSTNARPARRVRCLLLVAALAGCGDATAPDPGDFVASIGGFVASVPGGGGVLEVELLIDGRVGHRRSFQSSTTQTVQLEAPGIPIRPGAHRASLRIVRQTTSPSSYSVDIVAIVTQRSTGEATLHRLAGGGGAPLSLATGGSVHLDFTVGP
jgi:hypothetical protein